VLDAQLEERPLAKMQEELQEAEDAKEATSEVEEQDSAAAVNGLGEKPVVNGHADNSENGGEGTRSPTPSREKHPRKALLKNTDTELIRVRRVSVFLQLCIFV
jgi:RNA polymerase II subunit A C-terminal domain phosphatase